jgi:hypothetical protein
VENVDGFTNEQCTGVNSWLNFYKNHKKYKFIGDRNLLEYNFSIKIKYISDIGYLEGLYYDKKGKETEYYKKFLNCLETKNDVLWTFPP